MRVLACLALLTLATPIAAAHGALAVGIVGNDKANAGVSLGWTAEIATRDQAISQALNYCKTSPGMRDEAKASCRVVATFSGACFATATVARPSTSGFGWAVARTKEAAATLAMSLCRESAGKNADLCKPDLADCDTVSTAAE